MGFRHLHQARITKKVLIKAVIGFSLFVITGVVFYFIFPQEKYYYNDQNDFYVQDLDKDIEHALLMIKIQNPGNEHLIIEDLRLDENYRYNTESIKFCTIFGLIMVPAWIVLRFLNRLVYGEDGDTDEDW